MAPNPRRIDARLDALYEKLPKMKCQGLCHDSCGAIGMSVRERQRIESAHGPVTCGTGADCSMLDEDRRCRAYDIRPMVCRLWGLVRSMPCPYGCRPEGGLLSDAEGFEFLAEAKIIGGPEPDDRTIGEMQKALDELRALPPGIRMQRAAAAVKASGHTPPDIAGRYGALPRTVLDR